MNNTTITRKTIAVLISSALSACGGGGGGIVVPGGGGGTSVTVSYAPHLTQIKADKAHALGYKGNGVTVAVLDSGARVTHTALSGRVTATYNAIDGTTDVTDNNGHGTHVGALVAGSSVSNQYIGAAPQAKLLVIKSFETGSATSATYANGINYAVSHASNPRLLSISAVVSVDTTVDNALQNATGADKLIVVGAGNAGGNNPNGIGYFANDTAKYGGKILVVGSVNSANQISSFSNRAGISKDYFVVAPGEGVLSAYNTSDTASATLSGTSQSTPLVSGLAALIWSKWPTLTALQVADIIKQTATDLGDPGVDAIYGYGLVNAEAALSPVNPPTLLSLGPVRVYDTRLILPPALASLSGHPLLRRVAAVDTYGRDFYYDLSATVTRTPVWLRSRRLRAFMAQGTISTGMASNGSVYRAAFVPGADLGRDIAGQWVGNRGEIAGIRYHVFDFTNRNADAYLYATGPSSLMLGSTLSVISPVQLLASGSGTQFSMADGRWQVGVTHVRGREDYGQKSGLTTVDLRYRANRHLRLSASMGLMNENGLLSASGAGGFGGLRSRTRFIDLGARYGLGGGAFATARYIRGRTSVDTGPGLLTGFSALDNEAWTMGVHHAAGRHRSGVRVASPLRVTRGSAMLSVPTGMAQDGSAMVTSERINLAPRGKEIKLELYYRFHGRHTRYQVNLLRVRQPGNRPNAATETVVALRFERRF